MIYVKLWSVNFHGTVTNERSHVAKELSDDLINSYPANVENRVSS